MSDEASGPAGGDAAGDGQGERPVGAAGDGQGERPGDAADLLGEMRALRRRVRSARHAYWFPLVLFGVLTLASAPFYVLPGAPAGRGAIAQSADPLPVLGGFPGPAVRSDLGYYWLAALLAGLLLTLLWYRWNARRVGLQTPARASVVTVAVLTVLALVIPILSQVRSLHFLGVLWPGDLVIRGTFPFVIIAAGLWVLAWAERSRALAVIAAVYTATALVSSLYNIENVLFRLGWNPAGQDWSLTSLPNVLLPAFVLLVAGAGAFTAQRRHRARA
jgi:hypothetical protein